jgi:quercetin dioxygenase-like cupin family protein
MAKLSITAAADVTPSTAYAAPRVATGVIDSRSLAPEGYSLFCAVTALADGATITWDEDHGDDGVYVIDGEVIIDGRTCPTGGAIIVESGVAAVAQAHGPARVVHVGSYDATPPNDGPLGPPDHEGHRARVFGPLGMYESGRLEDVRANWFSDGSGNTSRLQLFTVTAPPNHHPGGMPHSHSTDEIIYLLDGTISMGAYRLTPGSALCVPSNVRYSLVGHPEGHMFLNVRRDVSQQVNERGSAPKLETAAAREGHVTNDVR